MDAFPGTWHGHVIVCGLQDVGLRVVEQLRLAGERVVVVDDSPDPRLTTAADELGAVRLAGNPRRAATLQAAGVAGAAAIVCTDAADLANLEVALLARRLRPDLRVVTQLGNAAVRAALTRLDGPSTVLDVAEIAAPSFAASCLELRSRALELDGEPLLLQDVSTPHAGTLRTLYGDRTPVAVVPADGSELAVCPPRDHPVAAGDRVVLISTPDAPAEAGLPEPEAQAARRRRRRTQLLGRYVRGFVSSSEQQLRSTLRVLIGVAIVSVVLLRVGYTTPDGGHMSVLDAAYFTTETLTTVGFGDFHFGEQNTWLRVWAIALMIIGATLVTILYALLTNLLVSRRIAQSLGRQLATRMRDHVVLVGLGSVGLRVLELLIAAGQQVVVLDRDEDNRFLARARELGVPVVFGDSTVPASLDAVNLRNARAVAVLTSNDFANIETGLAVSGLLDGRRAEVPVVLRVFDRDLAATVEASFGFDSVRSASALSAPWFVGAALGLRIDTTFYVEDRPMLIGRLTVAAEGGLQGRPMSDLSARLRVIALRRSGATRLEYPLRRETRFAADDEAWVVGPYEELLQLLRRDAAAAGAD